MDARSESDTSLDSKNNPAEINALLGRIETNLDSGAAAALHREICLLAQCTIYSDCDAYKKWNDLKPRVVRCLFRELTFEEFLNIPTGFNLGHWDIREALDEDCEEIPLSQLQTVAERFGMPSEGGTPGLFQRLVQSPDESVTEWLNTLIQQRLPEEGDKGISLSGHLKTMREFQFVRWLPDDKGLSDVVEILARRTDPLARQLTEKYLFSLPWGEDRRATEALISALGETKTEENHVLLKRALSHFCDPSPLRKMLLSAYANYALGEALAWGLQDLNQVDTEDARESYLDWFWSASEGLSEESGAVNERLEESLGRLNLRKWASVSRGYLAIALRTHAPHLKLPDGIRWLDFLSIRIVRVFNLIRVEHMSCTGYIFALVAIVLLYLWVLNHVVGPPPGRLAFLDMSTVLLWFFVSMSTMHTHFSGGETLRDRFRMGLVLCTAILCFLLVPLAIRLLPR